MSTERDVTRIVRSWMDEGVTALPDRVLDAVLDQLPATPQRRAPWLAWRFPIMNNTLRIGLAAAAVVAAVVIGLQFIGPTSVVGPPDATPTPSSTESSSATPRETGSTPAASMLPDLPMPGARVSSRGDYGWTGALGSLTGMHSVVDGATAAPRQTQIIFAVVKDCFGNPGGPTPTSVTVAGFDGLYIEPYEPPDGRIVTFVEHGSETTGAYALAIGDRTLCVYLSWDPTTTTAELAAARAVVESLRAEPVGPTGIRIVFTVENGWDTG